MLFRSPATAFVNTNATQQFTATGQDQFGAALTTAPSFTWSVLSGDGSVNSTTGLYTAPASVGTGSAVVQAAAGSFTGSSTVTLTLPSTLPIPWTAIDINATPQGNESVIDGIWTINSGGTGLEHTFTADSFHFVDRVLDGDGTIIARLTSRGTTAGVMFRESNASGASYAAVWLNWKGLQWVTREGSNTYSALRSPTVLNTNMPVWLKVVRSGNGFTASYSYDGSAWTQLGARTFTMSPSVLVGLAVGNGSATFSDVSVTPTVNTPPTVVTAAAATPSPVNAGNSATRYATRLRLRRHAHLRNPSSVPSSAVVRRVNCMNRRHHTTPAMQTPHLCYPGGWLALNCSHFHRCYPNCGLGLLL